MRMSQFFLYRGNAVPADGRHSSNREIWLFHEGPPNGGQGRGPGAGEWPPWRAAVLPDQIGSTAIKGLKGCFQRDPESRRPRREKLLIRRFELVPRPTRGSRVPRAAGASVLPPKPVEIASVFSTPPIRLAQILARLYFSRSDRGIAGQPPASPTFPWPLALGPWSPAPGPRPLTPGPWSPAAGPWFPAPGPRPLAPVRGPRDG